MSEYVKNPMIDDYIARTGATGFASVDAEKAVIGGMLQSQDAVEDVLNELEASDFSDFALSEIYRVIVATHEKGESVNLVTVSQNAESMAKGMLLSPTMVDCIQSCPTLVGLMDYAAIVKELSIRRKAIKLMQNTLIALNNPENDLDGVLDSLKISALNVEGGKDEWQDMASVIKNTFNDIEKRAKGEVKSITTGVSSIDSLIGGFFPGEVTVIGARPGIGKSAFGANIALSAAKNGSRVAIVSREMTDIQFGQRIFANKVPIDGMKLRKAELDADDWADIVKAMPELVTLPVRFSFNTATVEGLRKQVQRLAQRNAIDILIVDYIQIMGTTQKFEQEHLRVGHMSKMLKRMAIDFNIPVIVLAQVNRGSDGSMPTLANLKASGSIEEDADGVIFLHRPTHESDASIDPRDREFFKDYEKQGYKYMSIGIAKQRQGAIGKTCVLFDSRYMRYTPIYRD